MLSLSFLWQEELFMTDYNYNYENDEYEEDEEAKEWEDYLNWYYFYGPGADD